MYLNFFYSSEFFLIPDFILMAAILFIFCWHLFDKSMSYKVLLNNLIIVFFFITFQYGILTLYAKDYEVAYFSSLAVDQQVISLKLLVSVFFFIYLLIHRISVFSSHHLDEDDNSSNNKLYILLICLSILSLFFLISSNTFVILYLTLELISLASCILISTTLPVVKQLHYSLYYFIIGTLASCILLLGLVYLYRLTGTLSFGDLSLLCSFWRYNDGYNLSLICSLSLISVGVMIKGGMAPFHFWVVDLYSFLPYYVLFYFLIFSKFSVMVIFWKVVTIFTSLNTYISYFLICLGLLNILIGTMLAISQFLIKKFLICSSIANTGYLVLSLTFYTDSIFIFYIYLVTYLVTMLGVFLILSSFSICSGYTDFNKIGLANRYKEMEYLTDLMFLPFYKKVIFSVFIFSLMGVPPLAGFWGKLLLIYHFSLFNLYFVILSLQILNVVSLVYYLNVCKLICFDETCVDFYTYCWLKILTSQSETFNSLKLKSMVKNSFFRQKLFVITAKQKRFFVSFRYLGNHLVLDKRRQLTKHYFINFASMQVTLEAFKRVLLVFFLLFNLFFIFYLIFYIV